MASSAADKPSVDGAAERKLKGYDNFKRHNPMSDKFAMQKFHHVEFWCADATNTYKRFQRGLGMTLVAKSDQSTGNPLFASYVLQSNDLTFVFTAPYSRRAAAAVLADASATRVAAPLPHFSQEAAYQFLNTHGLAVKAIGVLVDDTESAYGTAVANGARSALAPLKCVDGPSGADQTIAEVELYGDVTLRLVSGGFKGPFLANYAAVKDAEPICFGLQRLDHAVGNVPNLIQVLDYMKGFSGMHEFAEFVAADVGTVDSGLNSAVLSSNNNMVLLPVNEPTFGTPRKSQIQTYLEQNEGPGLQHMALKTDNIFTTMRAMKAQTHQGGFEFMPPQSDSYYERLPERIGKGELSDEQLAAIKELGLLADRDDAGILLQIFSKPLGDRPTIFIEIIQRIGCMHDAPGAAAASISVGERIEVPKPQEQAGGCGGFGKGNFSELFKSIEDYERTLKV